MERFWPEKYDAAVSLTFDEGHISQRQVALPLLDAARLKASFYIPAGDPLEESEDIGWTVRLKPWVDAARRGHEIGNHSLAHVCSRALTGEEGGGPYLEDVSLAWLENDFLEASRRLREVLPVGKEMTFAYPCGETHVGAGATRASYVPLVARLFDAGRSVTHYPESHNRPQTCDLACLGSVIGDRMSGKELVRLVELAVQKQRWAIFTFHHVGPAGTPALTVAEGALQTLTQHLAAQRKRIWTAPVADVAAFVGRRREELARLHQPKRAV